MSPQIPTDVDLDAPLILVSADDHIGPRLKEDLRDYCPKQYLEEFDDYTRAVEPISEARRNEVQKGVPRKLGQMFGPMAEHNALFEEKFRLNACSGHHDVHERIRDMDRDGVACEVIYHGSQNGQHFPLLDPAGQSFNAMVFTPVGTPHELELAAVGQHIYNRWLADQCSVEPERHIGLAHLPMWDVDAAIKELEWAGAAGLKGVNFPGPKLGIKPYDHPAWEPFWSLCEELGMSLNTHDGNNIGLDTIMEGLPHTLLMIEMDELPRKMLPRMIFSGLFERHPKLRFLLTELQMATSTWWTQTATRYDQLWEANLDRLRPQLPHPPSEYLKANVFLGNSLLFMVPKEVELAVRDGYASNLLWGSDYPHGEGSYQHPVSDDEEPMTTLGLRSAFAATPPAIARDIIGETAVEVYGLDREKLLAVAKRINAPTLRHVGTPLESIPEVWKFMARTQLPWPEYRGTLELV